jgi:hypothetical protein
LYEHIEDVHGTLEIFAICVSYLSASNDDCLHHRCKLALFILEPIFKISHSTIGKTFLKIYQLAMACSMNLHFFLIFRSQKIKSEKATKITREVQ